MSRPLWTFPERCLMVAPNLTSPQAGAGHLPQLPAELPPLSCEARAVVTPTCQSPASVWPVEAQ